MAPSVCQTELRREPLPQNGLSIIGIGSFVTSNNIPDINE
jgi:hypothetical protein